MKKGHQTVSYLFSSLFSLIFYLETTILEKREERKEKSEKNKKKRQPSVENCRFFLAEKERSSRDASIACTVATNESLCAWSA